MAKTWEYRGRVIEEDFESWADPGRMKKTRTGYIIRAAAFAKRTVYVPGKYRTLVEAKRAVDEVIEGGFW
jgi:hypothetical protein